VTFSPGVTRLNLHQLQHFAVIAREGSLVRAAGALGVTHSNLSVQMKALEKSLGARLFERHGRRLVLTSLGTEVAFRADELVRLGHDVKEVARGHERSRAAPFRVGIVGSLPKALAFRLLEPALPADGSGAIVTRQDTYPRLLEELALGQLHLVIADVAPEQGGALRLFGHLLGRSPIRLYGAPKLGRRHARGFPGSLANAPMLLPSRGSSLRVAMDRWLEAQRLEVSIRGEFDDAGLLRIFGLRGRGIFPVRAALEAESEDLRGVVCLGEPAGLEERYYAISVERRVRHPAAAVLIDAARRRMQPAARA
jgi:LysR family transcriptional regulator, transcriptional activator of nhaA